MLLATVWAVIICGNLQKREEFDALLWETQNGHSGFLTFARQSTLVAISSLLQFFATTCVAFVALELVRSVVQAKYGSME